MNLKAPLNDKVNFSFSLWVDTKVYLRPHLFITLQRIPITDRIKSLNTSSSLDTSIAWNLTAPHHALIIYNHLSGNFIHHSFQVTLLLFILSPCQESPYHVSAPVIYTLAHFFESPQAPSILLRPFMGMWRLEWLPYHCCGLLLVPVTVFFLVCVCVGFFLFVFLNHFLYYIQIILLYA